MSDRSEVPQELMEGRKDSPEPLGFMAGERRPPAKIEWQPRLLAGEEAKVCTYRKLTTDYPTRKGEW